jgi:hypothetical protein
MILRALPTQFSLWILPEPVKGTHKSDGTAGRVPIGVEKRTGAFFRKIDHHLRAVLQDGLRRLTDAPDVDVSAWAATR